MDLASRPLAPAHRDTPATLRRCLITLSAVLAVGTGAELALERHWGTTVRLIPWFTIAVVLVGVALLAVRPTGRAVRLVRGIALAVAISGAFGVYEHILENYNSGPLDFRYADRWATMSFTARWWAALSKSVGPAPILAPAVLMQAGVLLLLATLHHPALVTRLTGRLGGRAGRHTAAAEPLPSTEAVGGLHNL